ncbi:MAG TPA: AAA family ATPase [Candidatus Dormibacteraeota bacterium]|nr:AAA family ATPase [Candidatus Dormibacteraeota bacterium]
MNVGRVAAPSATSIFGRDEELVRISGFLNAIPAGPQALLVEGEPGMGKTTVWRWSLEEAARRFRVLSCRSAEAEAKFSYAALTDLLEGVVEESLSALAAPQRHALEVALLREAEPGETLDSRAVAAAVLASLRTLAKSTPVLLGIDDAHWLDQPSARVLQFAIRRLQVEPIGVLLVQRTREDRSVSLGLDRALPADRFSRLELAPLSLGALHHMVRSRLGAELPRPVLVQLHQISGGNPFYALEIARDLLAQDTDHPVGTIPVPKSLRELVEGRLERLPRKTRDALLTVAALSSPTVTIITSAAESPQTVEAELKRAERAGVIEIEADRVRFSHPLLASVHYATASAAHRRALHRRLAEVVSDVEERARHLALATTDPDEEIAQTIDEAAQRARARGAPETAAVLLEEARRLTPAGEPDALWRRMTDGAMCHYLAGNTERARELWEEIERSAPAGPVRARALWYLSEFRHSTVEVEQQITAMDRALGEAGSDVALKSAIHHTLGLSFAWGGANARRAKAHVQAALELAEAQTDPTVVGLACTAVLWVGYMSGEGLTPELIDRCLAVERATQHLPLENSPRMAWAWMISQLGETPDLARRAFGALRQQAHDHGLDISLPLLYFFVSDLECRAGDLDLADRCVTDGLEAAARTEQLFRIPLLLLARALVMARRGRLDTACSLATESLTLNKKSGTRLAEGRIWALLGFIELSRGDPESANGWLQRVTELEERGGFDEPTVLRSRHDAIEALIALGRLEEAMNLLETLEERGRRLNRAWALAMAARCRALLAAAHGDLAGAQIALAQALVAHDRLVEPFELGRTLLIQGNIQRRSRQKRASRDSLERALGLFQNLGALGWAAQVEAETQRLGLHPAGPDELSATEERVARLVAEGRTNREIASAMFVSVKAVEANLTRIYTKLALRSRTELALRLQESPSSPVRDSRSGGTPAHS